MTAYPTPIAATSGTVFTAATWNVSPAAVDAWMRKPPQASLQQTVAQSIPSGSNTAISFDTTIRDNYNGHHMTTRGDAWTAPAPGIYHVTGMINMTGSAGPAINPSLISGSGSWAQLWIPTAPAPVRFQLSLSALIPMAPGDYVQLMLWQTSGSAQSTGFSTTGCRLSTRWVGI